MQRNQLEAAIEDLTTFLNESLHSDPNHSAADSAKQRSQVLLKRAQIYFLLWEKSHPSSPSKKFSEPILQQVSALEKSLQKKKQN